MAVYHIKLVTGEELVAELARDGQDLVLMEPMVVDISEMEGVKLVSMSRFNPFSRDRLVRIHRSNVLFLNPVLKEVADYHQASVRFHRQKMDEAFRKGMASAALQQLDQDPDVEVLDQEVSTTVH